MLQCQLPARTISGKSTIFLDGHYDHWSFNTAPLHRSRFLGSRSFHNPENTPKRGYWG